MVDPKVLFITITAVLHVNAYDTSVFVIYGTGKGQLRVSDINSKEVIRRFEIQTKCTKGGIAADFQSDLIFFADEAFIYKIYLVDGNGERKISGKGELFLNNDTDHFELVFYRARTRVECIYLDVKCHKLYAVISDELFEINPDTAIPQYTRYIGYKRFVKNLLIHDDVLYAHLSASHRYHGILSGIYKSIKDKQGYLKSFEPLFRKYGFEMTSFTIDNVTNRLFYSQFNAIKMFDANMTSVPSSIRSTRVILADSAVTKDVHGIGVYDKYVIWSSVGWQRIFIGEMSEAKNIIHTKDVKVLDGAIDDDIRTDHLFIFEG